MQYNKAGLDLDVDLQENKIGITFCKWSIALVAFLQYSTVYCKTMQYKAWLDLDVDLKKYFDLDVTF